ncbi:MAG: hypothetical protein HUJ58_03740 [Erysipelotrichaceae bacterium]|nr:hypothetical protein [Erysipelotrichaceae bacterium]
MKTKTYIYDPKRYAVRITGIGYFSIFLLFYSIYAIITGSIAYLFITVCSLYIIYETFVTVANPNEVIISDQEIVFKNKYQTDTYRWKDIKDFRCKEFMSRRQIYLRINKQKFDFLKGRYWISCYYFNDTDELFRFFINKESEIHPDTVKAYALRGSKPVERNDKK